VKKKAFHFLHHFAFSKSFLDRTVAARRPEKPAESTTGIIPGDRGKIDRSWCGQSLPTRASAFPAGKYHQFLWTVS
jgi:hypothetical protein